MQSLRPTERFWSIHIHLRYLFFHLGCHRDLDPFLVAVMEYVEVQVPQSYQKTMSNAIQVFLEMQGIELLEGDVRGHRKDLDEYYTVEDATIEEIRALAATGAPADDVANQIQKRSKLSPDLIKYIAKTKITA